MRRHKAFITSCRSVRLERHERIFFRKYRPAGLILFARNCQNPGQIARLAQQFRQMVRTPDAPVLLDQEGGAVARLGPPRWRKDPGAGIFGRIERRQAGQGVKAAYLNARLQAHDLRRALINVNCAPMLDIAFPDSHDIITRRAISSDPQIIVKIGHAIMQGLGEGGVLPVIKHMPGHGRAKQDSHHILPIVKSTQEELMVDFAPFQQLRKSPLAMSAHILYPALDPVHNASFSRKIIRDIIRSKIGFANLLLSDDLSMQALHGNLEQRAFRALRAGCDLVLHCNGKKEEIGRLAKRIPFLQAASHRRFLRCLGKLRQQRYNITPCDRAGVEQKLAAIFNRFSQI